MANFKYDDSVPTKFRLTERCSVVRTSYLSTVSILISRELPFIRPGFSIDFHVGLFSRVAKGKMARQVVYHFYLLSVAS